MKFLNYNFANKFYIEAFNHNYKIETYCIKSFSNNKLEIYLIYP